MIETISTILKQEKIADGIWRMDLCAPEIAAAVEPGQFVDLYCRDKSRLLPRPISVYDAEGDTLSLIYAVVGKGTEEFAAYEAGEQVRVTGPLGHGFPIEEALKAEEVLLVGGGLGIPPLQFTAKMLKNRKPELSITSVLGFRSMPWIQEPFPSYGAVLNASDDGACGFKGNVVDRFKDHFSRTPACKRVLFACGPIPMMKAIQQIQEEYGLECWFSLEERMGCGFGACYGCPAQTTEGLKRVCKDGPVFSGKEVIFS